MSNCPVRVKSANGQPPAREFMRSCRTCSADFLALAPGKTGERGLWSEAGWFCSLECAPEELRAVYFAHVGDTRDEALAAVRAKIARAIR